MGNQVINVFVTALFVTAIYNIVSHGAQVAQILNAAGSSFANIQRAASGK